MSISMHSHDTPDPAGGLAVAEPVLQAAPCLTRLPLTPCWHCCGVRPTETLSSSAAILPLLLRQGTF